MPLLKSKKFYLGILISVGSILVLVVTVDWVNAGEAFTTANYWWILPAVVIFMAGFLARAKRWGYLLRRIKRIRFMPLFKATMIGFMANSILPARVGEIIGPLVLARDERIKKSSVIASAVINRLLDGFTLMVIWLGTVLAIGVEKSGNVIVIAMLFVGYIVLTSLIYMFYRFSDRTIGWIKRAVARFNMRLAVRVGRILVSFADGLNVFSNRRHLGMAVYYSLLVWGCSVTSTWLVMQGFNFSVGFPAYTSFLLVALVCLGIAIPSSPGYIGTFELSTYFSLNIANPAITMGEALSFALILHLMQILPIIFVGLIFLWVGNVRLSDYTKRKEVEEGRITDYDISKEVKIGG